MSEESSHEFVQTSLDGSQDAAPQKKNKAGGIKRPKKKAETARAQSKKRSHKDVEHSDKISEQLAHIYQNQDGSLPDMRQFESKQRGRLVRASVVFILAILFFGSVAWCGFFYFSPASSFSESDVIVTVSGEENIVIGQDIRYRIRYRNDQSVSLTQVRVQVKYPDGFEYKESSRPPDEETNDTWTLGDVVGNDSGFIDVFGRLYGDLGVEQSLRVFFNYVPSNFSSEFQKVSTVSIKTASSPFEIEVQGPEFAAQGVEVPFKVLVRKDPKFADIPTGPLSLIVDANGIFSKRSSEPESDQFDEYVWHVQELPADGFTLSLKGVFLGPGGGEVRVPFRLVSGKKGETNKDDFFVLAQAEHVVDINEKDIRVTPIVNGSTGSFAVQPGDILNASIVFQNSTEQSLDNVRVRAIFDAPSFNNRSILDWVALEDNADGDITGEQVSDVVRRGTITWTSHHTPALAHVAPGQKVTIDIRIPVKTNEDVTLANYQASHMSLIAEAQYTIGGTGEVISSAPVDMAINSDVALRVLSEKKDAIYSITWLLSNSFHDLKDIDVSADVFGDVDIDAGSIQPPAGSIEYNKEDKRLAWHVDAMPISVDVLALQFPITVRQFNPSQTQLVSKVRLSATDTVTGETIILVGDDVGLSH